MLFEAEARPQTGDDGTLTIYDAARRLLLALNRLDEGSATPGFAGWQNGKGEPIGDVIEAARAELAALLDIEYPAPQPIEIDEADEDEVDRPTPGEPPPVSRTPRGSRQ